MIGCGGGNEDGSVVPHRLDPVAVPTRTNIKTTFIPSPPFRDTGKLREREYERERGAEAERRRLTRAELETADPDDDLDPWMRRPIGSRYVRLCGSVGACVGGERGSSPRGCGAPSGTGGYGGGGPGGRSRCIGVGVGVEGGTRSPPHICSPEGVASEGCPSPSPAPVPCRSLQPTLCVARPPLPPSPLSLLQPTCCGAA